MKVVERWLISVLSLIPEAKLCLLERKKMALKRERKMRMMICQRMNCSNYTTI